MVNQNNETGLLAQLRGISEENLLEHIKATEGLSDDALDRHKKFSDYWKNIHWDDCRKTITTATACVIAALIIFAAIAIMALSVRYIYDTLQNPADIKELLCDLKDWLLLAFSVLFVESKLKKE